ncbi:MAG: hypothetical protein LBN08_04705 [Lactobacillales bacterium]|jgi:hypothetical protein|nr:hypothetical protein [Lactobacillales bacterium]
MAENKQKIIKSKKRVADHGEVFTPEFIVQDMLKLVEQETLRIDSRFLEPACGDGNFLDAILSKKLEVCESRNKNDLEGYERDSFLAMTSIYGIDLLEDNVAECRNRLYETWFSRYKKKSRGEWDENVVEAVKHVLRLNITCGDALTLEQADETPIVFPEWAFISEKILKRRDFEFVEMLRANDNRKTKRNQDQLMLFDTYNEEANSYIPDPVKEYKPVDFRKVQMQ